MFAGFDKDTWGSRNNQSKDYFKDYTQCGRVLLTGSTEWPLQTPSRFDLVKRHCLFNKYRMYTDSPDSVALHRVSVSTESTV